MWSTFGPRLGSSWVCDAHECLCGVLGTLRVRWHSSMVVLCVVDIWAAFCFVIHMSVCVVCCNDSLTLLQLPHTLDGPNRPCHRYAAACLVVMSVCLGGHRAGGCCIRMCVCVVFVHLVGMLAAWRSTAEMGGCLEA